MQNQRERVNRLLDVLELLVNDYHAYQKGTFIGAPADRLGFLNRLLKKEALGEALADKLLDYGQAPYLFLTTEDLPWQEELAVRRTFKSAITKVYLLLVSIIDNNDTLVNEQSIGESVFQTVLHD